ncbi:polymorphic toxin type 33 domain-containing protein [Nocardia sp. NPDC058518]|uniref:polymorphic toxin type 33 domain-containing protein n=1 Tax=Nocardia sp. NPDC058518 TaxID=3346534 RepID=UPI003667D488
MTWTIDTGMYYDAGNKCHALANDLSLALGPLNAALQHQCGGMAGNHESCNNWITAYDNHANEIVTLAATLANALLRYGDVLQANGYNWWYSNRTAATGSEPTKPTESEPLYDSGMALPVSSRGDNGPGLDEGVIVGLLERVGRIPNGDKDKLGIARDAWKTFAEHATVTGAATTISGVKAKFDGNTDPNIIAIDEKLATLEQAAKLLAEAAKGIVTPLTEHNDALSTMREDIGKQVAAAAVEIGAAIALTVVIVGVAAFLTAGVGAAAAGAGGTAVTIEIVESTAVIIKNTVTVSRMVTAVGAVITIGVASGGFTAIPDLTQAGLTAAVGAIAAMAVYIAADEAADDEPVWDRTEERTRNPAQDKILTDKDIRELKSRGHDPHDVKPDPPSRYDLYKDGKGNVYIKPKGGKGPGDPTGIRLQ